MDEAFMERFYASQAAAHLRRQLEHNYENGEGGVDESRVEFCTRRSHEIAISNGTATKAATRLML